jgi:hypothetical protein
MDEMANMLMHIADTYRLAGYDKELAAVEAIITRHRERKAGR